MANFHIEKKIGRGQFSEVYKATYLLDGQLVALKKVQVQLFVLSRIAIHVVLDLTAVQCHFLFMFITVEIGVLQVNVFNLIT